MMLWKTPLCVLILFVGSMAFAQVKLSEPYTPKDLSDIRNVKRTPANHGPVCQDVNGKEVFKGQSEYDICILRDRANKEVRRIPVEPGSQFKY